MLPTHSATQVGPGNESEREGADERNLDASAETSKSRQTRRSRAEVGALVKEFHESGLSRAQFAKKRGIPISTVHSWLRRRRKPPRKAASPPTAFVPVQVLAMAKKRVYSMVVA